MLRLRNSHEEEIGDVEFAERFHGVTRSDTSIKLSCGHDPYQQLSLFYMDYRKLHILYVNYAHLCILRKLRVFMYFT